jgi:hypothetical protein
MTAAYDEIADWYEQELLHFRPPRTPARRARCCVTPCLGCYLGTSSCDGT